MFNSYLRLLKISLLLSSLIPLVPVYCTHRQNFILALSTNQRLLFLTLSMPVLAGIAIWALARSRGYLESIAERQAQYLDTIPKQYLSLAVYFAALVSLLLELSVIRWQSAVFPVFAFYKNLSLLSCFAGLGLGYALAARNSIPLFFLMPTLIWQMLLFGTLRFGVEQGELTRIWLTPFTEQLNMGIGVARSVAEYFAISVPLVTTFLTTALMFLPLGQVCGRLMGRGNSLRVYGDNLLGSITGVILLLVLSYLWTGPIIWFMICFVVILSYFRYDVRVLYRSFIFASLAAIILAWPMRLDVEQSFSPYQSLERRVSESGLTSIYAAGHYHQRIFDLSLTNENRYSNFNLKKIAAYYELPYHLHSEPLHNVAIVGSGTGNDVAAALRCGAEHVEAIEIDPAILQMGELYHPERPYGDERVSVIINDARSFLRTTARQYDMIVYGLLDSHTLLSHASNIRLDSFVYTLEGLKEARSRLRDDGLISLSFAVLSDQIGKKLYLMMQEAFDGIPPICISSYYDGSVIFAQSKNGGLRLDEQLLKETGFENVTDHYGDPAIKADVSTDDWPFFYMPVRIYPTSYLVLIAIIFILSALMAFNFFGQQPFFSHSVFFFMGAGFMLIETKGITEMGLVFGNTWMVIGIVIIGILLMGYLANCCVQWWRLRHPTIPFFLLLLSLLAGLMVMQKGGLPPTFEGKIMIVLLLTLPMFFSGIIFSTLIRTSTDIAGILAINFLGAMLGGLLEYNSMYFGFHFLYFLAIGLYFLGWLALRIKPLKLS